MSALHPIAKAREALCGIAYGLDPECEDYPLVWTRNGVIDAGALRRPAAFRARMLLGDIAEQRRVTVNEICGRLKPARLVRVRKECAYRLRIELGLSWPRIGQWLGGRDHSSALYLAACWQAMHPHLPKVSGYNLTGKLDAARMRHARAARRVA
ncbi:MAG: helix-turn-helix domain-containing protein [Caulobacterales bacterium]|uniref:helix-turn-helix domain-containing protein n=1 Tax=Glycocaulis sp. TaxID=1969725 RepID=UPI003F9F95AD